MEADQQGQRKKIKKDFPIARTNTIKWFKDGE